MLYGKKLCKLDNQKTCAYGRQLHHTILFHRGGNVFKHEKSTISIRYRNMCIHTYCKKTSQQSVSYVPYLLFSTIFFEDSKCVGKRYSQGR